MNLLQSSLNCNNNCLNTNTGVRGRDDLIHALLVAPGVVPPNGIVPPNHR
jgi:hypothetical protein